MVVSSFHMPSRVQQLIYFLQLVRAELLFPAVADAWLMVFLALHFEPAAMRNPELAAQHSLPLTLLLATGVAGALQLYGTIINDMLDLRHDRVFAPHRPIAAGRIPLRNALMIAVLGLLIALGSAVFLGKISVLLCLAVAAGSLFYSAMGKYIPALGLLTLGLVKAVTMLTINPSAGFLWPILLALSHSIAWAALGHQLMGKRPRLNSTQGILLAAGWMFACLGLLAWMRTRQMPSEQPPLQGPWVLPMFAVLLMGLLAFWLGQTHQRLGPGRRLAGARFAYLGALGLILYDIVWLISAHHARDALIVAALLLADLLWTRLMHALEPLAEPAVSFRLEH